MLPVPRVKWGILGLSVYWGGTLTDFLQELSDWARFPFLIEKDLKDMKSFFFKVLFLPSNLRIWALPWSIGKQEPFSSISCPFFYPWS